MLNAKGLRRIEQTSLFNTRVPQGTFRGVNKSYSRPKQQMNAFRSDARSFLRIPRTPAVQPQRIQNRPGPTIRLRQGQLTVTKTQQQFRNKPIPRNPNKRIRVNRTGISVTTINNVAKVRHHKMVVDDEEEEDSAAASEDDLERLTVEDVVGRSSVPPSGRPFRPSGSRAAAMPTGRIRQRLDVNPRPSASRPAVLTEPVEGASVLVSNLHPQVTESDMRDLFQDIGPMQDARLVSTGTALVTFFRRATAIRACDTYHGRLLDGQPMNLILLTVGTSQSRSHGQAQPGPSASSSFFASKYL